MDNSFFRRSTAIFWLLLGSLAAVVLFLRIISLVQSGPDYVTTGFEDVCIFKISRIRHGDPFYSDCFSYPYRGSFYNWLFHGFYGLVAALANPSERSLPTVLRLATLALTTIGFVASVRFLVAFRPEGDAGPPLGRAVTIAQAGFTWLGPFVGWWALSTRPDVPGVVCEVLGLFLVARNARRPTLGTACLAGVCFFLAWSFKQSEVFILVGTVLALLIRREWLAAAAISTVFTALIGAVLLSADSIYFTNVFEAPRFAPWEARQFIVVVSAWFCTGGFLLLIGLGVLIFCVAAPRRRLLQSPAILTLSVVFGVTLPLNLLSCGRVGSSPNYFFESWVTGMILIGLLTRQAAVNLQAFSIPGYRAGYGGVLALMLIGVAFFSIDIFYPFYKPVGAPTEVMIWLPGKPYSADLLEEVERSAVPLLCEDSFLTRQALGSRSGGVPILEPTIYFDALDAGRIKDGGVARWIRERKYAVMWLNVADSYWEKEALAAGYVLREEREGVKCYVRSQQ